MALCVVHVLNVHITSDGHLNFSSILVIDSRLIVSGAAQKVGTIRIEGESIDWMAIKWLELSH
jgi:hypothetical protein